MLSCVHVQEWGRAGHLASSLWEGETRGFQEDRKEGGDEEKRKRREEEGDKKSER